MRMSRAKITVLAKVSRHLMESLGPMLLPTWEEMITLLDPVALAGRPEPQRCQPDVPLEIKGGTIPLR